MPTPPRYLELASRVYFVALIGSAGLVLCAWFFLNMGLAMVLFPALATHFLLQVCGTFYGSQLGAMLSGLTQLGVALASAIVFCCSVLFLFTGPIAPVLAFGSLVIGYSSYWMAWQNWVWVQRLRGIEEERILVPRTLSLMQVMILTAVAAALCGVASMAQQTFQQGP
ncbi:hypothetical protein [Blastopirellula marina]|uniref:Uncharacterized protein n=1 Tax=Blastopirellula marina TaxID=124 RepID=A0A2S8GJ81_9BACT|nr:hypothetical protein [Blastopirellula marina]PQO44420.1 hypothetical protein C5Y93_18555 [Blastopirellula marina]